MEGAARPGPPRRRTACRRRPSDATAGRAGQRRKRASGPRRAPPSRGASRTLAAPPSDAAEKRVREPLPSSPRPLYPRALASNARLAVEPSPHPDAYRPPREAAAEQLARERVLDQALDRAPQRPGAELRIVALRRPRTPAPRGVTSRCMPWAST